MLRIVAVFLKIAVAITPTDPKKSHKHEEKCPWYDRNGYGHST
jgi:hypothetical protein